MRFVGLVKNFPLSTGGSACSGFRRAKGKSLTAAMSHPRSDGPRSRSLLDEAKKKAGE
jgi:hypothetical protein